jgi:hypothetical protein
VRQQHPPALSARWTEREHVLTINVHLSSVAAGRHVPSFHIAMIWLASETNETAFFCNGGFA